MGDELETKNIKLLEGKQIPFVVATTNAPGLSDDMIREAAQIRSRHGAVTPQSIDKRPPVRNAFDALGLGAGPTLTDEGAKYVISAVQKFESALPTKLPHYEYRLKVTEFLKEVYGHLKGSGMISEIGFDEFASQEPLRKSLLKHNVNFWMAGSKSGENTIPDIALWKVTPKEAFDTRKLSGIGFELPKEVPVLDVTESLGRSFEDRDRQLVGGNRTGAHPLTIDGEGRGILLLPIANMNAAFRSTAMINEVGNILADNLMKGIESGQITQIKDLDPSGKPYRVSALQVNETISDLLELSNMDMNNPDNLKVFRSFVVSRLQSVDMGYGLSGTIVGVQIQKLAKQGELSKIGLDPTTIDHFKAGLTNQDDAEGIAKLVLANPVFAAEFKSKLTEEFQRICIPALKDLKAEAPGQSVPEKSLRQILRERFENQ